LVQNIGAESPENSGRTGMIYGYARVSTGSQSEAAQVTALKKHGAGKVFSEVAQGDRTDRGGASQVAQPISPRRRAHNHPARPAGPLNPRPVEHARGDHRQERRFPLAGRHMGRYHDIARALEWADRFKLTDHQKREAIKRRNQGETLADIARSYNVSPATISRLAA
jgi:DNA invertase Pin-like site-specific DNA recombinase